MTDQLWVDCHDRIVDFRNTWMGCYFKPYGYIKSRLAPLPFSAFTIFVPLHTRSTYIRKNYFEERTSEQEFSSEQNTAGSGTSRILELVHLQDMFHMRTHETRNRKITGIWWQQERLFDRYGFVTMGMSVSNSVQTEVEYVQCGCHVKRGTCWMLRNFIVKIPTIEKSL